MINRIMIGTSNTTLFTAPSKSVINCIIFCNTSSIADTLTVWLGGAVTQNTILSEVILEPHDSLTINLEKFILELNDVIVAVTTNGSINAVVSSMEM